MMNNSRIRVERGSLRRREEHKPSESPQSSLNKNNLLTLSASTTCLCDEPEINTTSPISNQSECIITKTMPNNKGISPIQYIKHKNNKFYSKTNMLIYQKKFKLIETPKKLSNIRKSIKNNKKNKKNILKISRQQTNYNQTAQTEKTMNYHYKLYLNKLLKSHIEFNKLFIIDWDDTLFPTSNISRKQLKAFDANPLFYGKTKELYYNIKQLIDIIISLFNTITKQNGKIIIVTNAAIGWINGIFSGYFAGVIGRLFHNLSINIKKNNIQIISARDEYLKKCPNKIYFDGQIAKTKCMQNIFKTYTKNTVPHKVPIIYCIGDGMDEFNASRTAWNKIIGHKYISILQRIKFLENPSIEILMQELQTVEGLINDDTNKKFIQWIINKKYIIDYI